MEIIGLMMVTMKVLNVLCQCIVKLVVVREGLVKRRKWEVSLWRGDAAVF